MRTSPAPRTRTRTIPTPPTRLGPSRAPRRFAAGSAAARRPCLPQGWRLCLPRGSRRRWWSRTAHSVPHRTPRRDPRRALAAIAQRRSGAPTSEWATWARQSHSRWALGTRISPRARRPADAHPKPSARFPRPSRLRRRLALRGRRMDKPKGSPRRHPQGSPLPALAQGKSPPWDPNERANPNASGRPSIQDSHTCRRCPHCKAHRLNHRPHVTPTLILTPTLTLTRRSCTHRLCTDHRLPIHWVRVHPL